MFNHSLIWKQKDKNLEEDGRKVFSMSEERNCPICGSKMKWLSFQLWQCKCGHKEKGEADVREEGEEKHERRLRWGAENNRRFREQKQPHKGYWIGINLRARAQKVA
jgi:hypothetical protein